MWCSNSGAGYTGLLGCDVLSLGMYFLMFGRAVVPSLLLATARPQTYRYNFPLKYLVSVYHTMRCNNPEVYSRHLCFKLTLLYFVWIRQTIWELREALWEFLYPHKWGTARTLPNFCVLCIVCFVSFSVLFVCTRGSQKVPGIVV